MKFWIDIEDSSETLLGRGPIQTAVRWNQTRRLNRAGSFDFTMPAVDDRADLLSAMGGSSKAPELAAKKFAMCHTFINSRRTELGGGIVDEIKTQISPNGEIMLDVRGDDLLRELTYKHVGKLQIGAASATLTASKAIKHTPSTKANVNIIGGGGQVYATTTYLYIGFTKPFSAFTPTVYAGNTNTVTLTAQYFSNNEEWASSGGWRSITITDGTKDTNRTFYRTGTISWTQPADWEMTRHNNDKLYWMRFAFSASTTAVTITTANVTGIGPTTTGPQLIKAFAPAGWTLDKDFGHDVTAKAVEWTFDGESVLAAFVKLAELTGERFRLAAPGAGRSLVWLQNDERNSNIWAVGYGQNSNVAANALMCVIVQFQETKSTYDDLVGRVYCEGADNTVLIDDATQTPPSGYTVSSDSLGDYIQHDATYTSYGISVWRRFSGAKTPDELYEAAIEELNLRKEAFAAYDIVVTGLDKIVYPGEIIHVQYRRTIGGYTAYDINDDFVILEVTELIDTDGRRSVALKISTVAKWPDTEGEMLAREVFK